MTDEEFRKALNEELDRRARENGVLAAIAIIGAVTLVWIVYFLMS